MLQPLESRRLLSTLTLTGTAGNDSIAVQELTTSSVGSTLNIQNLGSTTISATIGNSTATIAPHASRTTTSIAAGSHITAITAVDLGAGADRFAPATTLSIPVHATGGDGNDSLTGGSAADTLDGGEGDDSLTGGAGDDDYVFGTPVADQTDFLVEARGGGTDTLDFATSAAANPATVDLADPAKLATQDVLRTVQTALGTQNYFENVIGSPGDDFVLTNDAANRIDLGDGNDYAAPLSDGSTDANDTLLGGAGDDNLTGGNGNDDLEGGDGNDFLQGSAGNDTVRGQAGDDLLRDDDGDTVNSTNNAIGNDSVDGGDGNDIITVESGNDTLDGGLGDDTFAFDGPVAASNDQLVEFFHNGLDTMNFSGSFVRNDGGAFVAVPILVHLDIPSQLVKQGQRLVRAVGGTITQNVVGSPANDTMFGSISDDTLDGGGGADLIHGGAGNDQIFSDLSGGESGLAANVPGDSLYGDAGNDSITGGNGSDFLDGGDGNDRLVGDEYAFNNTQGTDTLMGQAGDDVLIIDRGNAFGGAGDDQFVNQNGIANLIDGGDGFDIAQGENTGVTDTFTNVEYLYDIVLPGNTGGAVLAPASVAKAAKPAAQPTTVTAAIDSKKILRIIGTAGNDSISVIQSGTTLTVTANGKTLGTFSTGSLTTVSGRQGIDIEAGDGNDSISLVASNGSRAINVSTRVRGGLGNDNILGGNAGDVLEGNAGNDTVNGGAGNDVLSGDDIVLVGETPPAGINDVDGNDVIIGGAGDSDIVSYTYRKSGVKLDLSSPSALSGGSGEKDNISGVEIVVGGQSSDAILGSAGSDVLFGGPGNDNITGGAGSNRLQGGLGSDSLTPNGGNDYVDPGVDNVTDIVVGAFDARRSGGGGAPTNANGNILFGRFDGKDFFSLSRAYFYV